jgi:hypothetical protein
MANIGAILSVSNSIIKFLESSYARTGSAEHGATFRLLSSGNLAEDGLDTDGVVSLYLYRVTVNDHLRNTRPHRAPELSQQPLPLDLHYLLSVWSGSAETEQFLLAWAMRHLHEHPILDRSSLTPDGGWAPDEVVHIVPDELSNEDLLRLWDTITPSYRISYSYVARVIQLEPSRSVEAVPVVAKRSRFAEVGGGSRG